MSNKTYHPRGITIDGYAAREHPNYQVWAGIKTRCTNPNEPSYKNYGGRGITYCAEWEHFATFCKDMGVRPSTDHSIERIDNDKGYSRSNCKWATRLEQAANRRKFKNNTSGETGVKLLRNGRYSAQYNTTLRRYRIAGSFDSVEDAAKARGILVSLLQKGKSVEHLIERKARFDSTTGVRGISRHSTSGGFIVRVTVDGERKYIGHYLDFEDAKEVLKNAKG